MITLKDREKGQRGMKASAKLICRKVPVADPALAEEVADAVRSAVTDAVEGLITDAVDEVVDSNDGPRVWISTITESKLMVNVQYDDAMYSGFIDLEVEEAEEE